MIRWRTVTPRWSLPTAIFMLPPDPEELRVATPTLPVRLPRAKNFEATRRILPRADNIWVRPRDDSGLGRVQWVTATGWETIAAGTLRSWQATTPPGKPGTTRRTNPSARSSTGVAAGCATSPRRL